MRVLIVGGGGREHAIVRALKRSSQQPELLCAPGNPGIAQDAKLLAIAADQVEALVAAAQQEQVDLVVVGPEAPLVAGITDAMTAAGIACFGPSAAAAKLEGSKAFSKEIMAAAGVPTADFAVVSEVEAGMAAIERIERYPVVIKADGLAAGKGVTIAGSEDEARATLTALLVERRFDTDQVVIEELLSGEELSLLAICDGERAYPLAPAQDFKRIYDGDQGPNTGGMGAYSPVPGFDAERIEEICAQVHQPVVNELKHRGTPFHGVLYAGLMIDVDELGVLEFNVRFGDPETQAVLPRLETDLLELMQRATQSGGLAATELHWSEQVAVTLVLASAGYPASSSSGDPISGTDALPTGIELTHAGTGLKGDQLVTAGGRVLNVTAIGDDLAMAREKAYAAAEQIEFPGKQLRRDIALRALERVG